MMEEPLGTSPRLKTTRRFCHDDLVALDAIAQRARSCTNGVDGRVPAFRKALIEAYALGWDSATAQASKASGSK